MGLTLREALKALSVLDCVALISLPLFMPPRGVTSKLTLAGTSGTLVNF